VHIDFFSSLLRAVEPATRCTICGEEKNKDKLDRQEAKAKEKHAQPEQ